MSMATPPDPGRKWLMALPGGMVIWTTSRPSTVALADGRHIAQLGALDGGEVGFSRPGEGDLDGIALLGDG